MNSRAASVLAYLTVAIAVLWIFFPLIDTHAIHADDHIHLMDNPRMILGRPADLLLGWTTPINDAYTPVTSTVWFAAGHWARKTINNQVNFHMPTFYRLNIAVYLATCLVVFLLLQECFASSLIPAFLGAVFFAVHPLHVETVSWLTALRDLLAGFFSFLSLYLFLRYWRAKDEAAKKAYGWYVAAIAAFFLSILSKPTAFATPLLIATLGVLRGRAVSSMARELSPCLLALPILVLQCFLNDSTLGAHEAVVPLSTRPLIALDAIAFYLGKVFFPIQLGFDYGRTPSHVIRSGLVLFTPLLPIAVGLMLWSRRHTPAGKVLLGAFGFFSLALIPALGLTSFTFQFLSTVADRYVYVSLFGPAFALAWLLAHRLHGKVWLGGTLVLLCLLAIKARDQVTFWTSEARLAENTLKINPRSWYTYLQLGNTYLKREEPEAAIGFFIKAAFVTDSTARRASQLNFLGDLLLKYDRTLEAVAVLENASALDPNIANPQYKLGRAWQRLGMKERALESFEKAVRLDPKNEIYQNALKAVAPKTSKLRS